MTGCAIVVPSVAIREGVYKSLQTTQEHFADEYGKKIRFFIYNSDRLTEVDRFASDSAINVMIINMQAFNSSKNQRIIDKKLDTFRSRKPIDIIAKTNPILIIDEPQSVEGKQTKESLKKFCPLFTLRYSATHKEKYDMVYRLDAMDAYNQHLVKKIAALGVTLQGSTATNSYVYLEGIDLYKDKSPTARLGFEVKGKTGTRTVVRKVNGNDDLYDLSDGLDEYADRFKILPNGIDGRDNSVTFLNGLKLYAGQISGSEQMVALQRRIQIRETIRTHIQREQELYRKGIKVLSLFFIDEVSKYRSYDGDDDAGRNGEYAQMFEEEYDSVVSELQRKIGDESYLRYLDKLSARTTHQGYFSIDKKKGKKARFVESKIDRKTQTSDDADAYLEIVREKRIDGLLLLSLGNQHLHLLDELVQTGIPMVSLSAVPGNLNIPTVSVNDFSGAKKAVSYLVKQGHRNIALLNGPRNLVSNEERFRGYCSVLDSNGIPYRDDFVIECDISVKNGRYAMEEFLNYPELTAVFVSGDLMAIGAIEAIRHSGKRIPDDISIVAYDNIAMSGYLSPALTTVNQFGEKKGRIAANTLIEQLEGIETSNYVIIEPKLVVRDSTASPHTKES